MAPGSGYATAEPDAVFVSSQSVPLEAGLQLNQSDDLQPADIWVAIRWRLGLRRHGWGPEANQPQPGRLNTYDHSPGSGW